MSRPIGVPRRYLLTLGRDIVGGMVLMLLAVEAIYLSNKMVTHLLFDTLRNQLGIGFLIETLVLAAPEILSVGFPLATLIAVYLALLRRREAGDFLILSGAGVSPWTLVGLSAGVSLLALITAFGLRGFVEPLAARHLALRLAEAQFEAAREGRLIPGHFLTIGNITLYQHPDANPDPDDAQSFVFQMTSPSEEWVITATRSRLVYAAETDSRFFELNVPRIYGFAGNASERYEIGTRIGVGQMRFGPVLINLPDASVARGRARTALPADLARCWLNEGDIACGRALLERLLSMALAFLAPLLATLAVALTRGPMWLAALPGALGMVLGGGLAITPASELLVGLGSAQALTLAIAALLAIGIATMLLTAKLIPASVLPQRIQL